MRRLECTASSAVLLAILATTAQAQETARPGPANANQENVIQEIVVTAEKREESLQDVPVAVTAFTSEQRDLVGITTVQDMTNFTPGLQYSTQIDRTSLRGIGRLTNVHSAEGGVAIYSDGIYTTSTVEAGKTPLFTDRVEVLRGPQGTLYGRNSISGAINVISRRPTDEWYAEVRATAANYNRTVLEAAVSGPTFLDNVQFRLTGNWEKQTEGWIENIVPGQPDEGNVIDQTILEGQLQFQFTEDFEGWVKLANYRWRNDAGGPGARASWTPHPYSTFLFQNAAVGPNEGYGLNPGTNGVNPSPLGAVNPALTDERKIASTIPYNVDLDDTYIFASEWIYNFDFAALKYIAGGTRYHYHLQGPVNPDAAPITQYTLGTSTVDPRYGFTYEEFLSWFSHELNLASNNDGDFQWLVGAYHFRENYRQPVSSGLLFEPKAAITVCAVGPPCAPNPLGLVYDSRPSLHITSKALYGQIDWTFAPTWKTTLGLRHSEDEKRGGESIRLLSYVANTFSGDFNFDLTRVPSVVNQTSGPPFPEGVSGPSVFDPNTGFVSRPYDAEWSATTGTAGLQWEPDLDTLAYVRYSKGYKAGGFRLGINVVPGPQPLTEQESADAYEAGLKKTFFDGRFQTNAAVFYYDYQNAQIPLSIPPSAGSTQGASVLFNVPEAVSQGIEFENIFQPVDGLQFLFNYSYLDAHVTEAFAIDPADPSALDHDAVPGVVTSIPDNFLPAATPVGSCGVTAAAPNGFLCQVRQNLDGDSLPNSPKHKVAFNVNYTRNVGPGDVVGSLSYTWRSEQYGSIFERSYYKSESNGQLDARVTFVDTDDRYTVILYGRNLTDEIVYEGGAFAERRAGSTFTGPVVQGIASTYPLAPPRTFGIELQYRFF